MSFLAPLFLLGALALAVPIVIHLTHREKKEVVPFPSLMFLRKIPYRSVRRQKLRHLFLFALRSLALVLIAFAFARPFFESPRASAASSTSTKASVPRGIPGSITAPTGSSAITAAAPPM